jgi:hypothetical protein
MVTASLATLNAAAGRPLAPICPHRSPENRELNLMDATKLVERFATIHGRRPKSKNELVSWFAKYASSPDGWIFICHLALDNHDRKGWRTALVRQMQTLYRDAHGREGSLAQIEKWTRSLEGKKRFDDWRSLDGRIEPNNELP